MAIKQGFKALLAACGLFVSGAAAAERPVTLEVDATDAPRSLLHARLHIPAAPGALTLYYPKWIPGDHSPTGPINDVTGLQFSANGQPLAWQRDAEEMCTFHLEVPTNADSVDVWLDLLLPSSGGSSSDNVLDLNWNQVLLYPRTEAPLRIPFIASLKLPAGWKYGTALPPGIATRSRPDTIEFTEATLETLVDSPVIAGEFFRTIDLTPVEKVPHYLQIVADDADALEIKPEDIRHYTRLVHEANALFGARHYRNYHFLLTLSDHVDHFGLEHHESSDDRESGDYLTDADERVLGAELLPHEMVHSWNGKYRRPAGLATPDYQRPMQGELLWVYEGLTDYYGKVLATRSGLETKDDFLALLALNAATLDHRSGRQWRPLADTTVSAQLLYDSREEGINRRRGVDFYAEGDLIWLEADTLIRQRTGGAKSLDDFCKAFHGGESGPPKVIPYAFDDVVQALNAIAPYDWKMFFQNRIYAVTPRAPLGGIENGGWRLAYTNGVPPYLKKREAKRKYTDLNYSLGTTFGADGGIGEIIPGSPADQAGFAPGMKLVAVNGRAWSAELLREAVKSAATNTAPIELLVQHDDFYKTYSLDYHDGEKYPVLEREATKPDLLDDILKPLTAEAPAESTDKK